MFGLLKKIGGAAAKEVTANYGENKDFLEAVVAGAALVAFADGDLEDSEKAKINQIITGHATLGKMYDRNTIEQTVDTMFKRAKDSSGRQALARELDDIKSRPNGSQMAEDVYLIAVDIANADGEVEEAEQVVLGKIANRLGVDVSKFDF